VQRVEELGQLLDHTGPVAQSERNAARIFNADHCFFVTNGTSTSNKMVWHHTVAPGDVVVVDRNCHKSILHSIIMTGAVPVFLTPTRNHYGIIGPIPQASSRPRPSRRRSPPTPCSRGGPEDRQAAHPDADAEHLRRRALQHRDHQARARRLRRHLHFDEAWLPHAAFHKFYGSFHSMGKNRPRPKDQMVFATQSTHKLLAGISQASQVLVQDASRAQARQAPLQRGLPDAHQHQPAVRHHCQLRRGRRDDGSAGRPGAGGREHCESLDFRRAMRKVDKEFGKDWWFKVWGPDKLVAEGIGKSSDWMLKAGDKWHGFGALADGFNLLDPIKCTSSRRGWTCRASSPRPASRRHRHQVPGRARRGG
jgi:arginine decarboxylase